MWNKLEKAGVRPERLQLEWISAAEGQKFAKVMNQMGGRVMTAMGCEFNRSSG